MTRRRQAGDWPTLPLTYPTFLDLYAVLDKAFPGAAIFVTTLVINLIGNALRDWLDPRLKL